MDDTGRIRRPLTPTARRIVFGEPEPAAPELALITEVDRAHLVMLAEQGLVDRAAAPGLDPSPLGAGTGHGSALPIAPGRTAELLGFDHPAPHALDAVAGRDLVLRLLAAASVFGVTASRLAADLLLWTTAEFAFL